MFYKEHILHDVFASCKKKGSRSIPLCFYFISKNIFVLVHNPDFAFSLHMSQWPYLETLPDVDLSSGRPTGTEKRFNLFDDWGFFCFFLLLFCFISISGHVLLLSHSFLGLCYLQSQSQQVTFEIFAWLFSDNQLTQRAQFSSSLSPVLLLYVLSGFKSFLGLV